MHSHKTAGCGIFRPLAPLLLFFSCSRTPEWNCLKKHLADLIYVWPSPKVACLRVWRASKGPVCDSRLTSLRCGHSLSGKSESPFDPQVKLQRRPLAKYVWERKLKRPAHLRSTALRVRAGARRICSWLTFCGVSYARLQTQPAILAKGEFLHWRVCSSLNILQNPLVFIHKFRI